MGPFDLLTPLPASRRGREPDVNAWVELHNAIVAAESPHDVGPETAERILSQRGVDLREAFLDARIDLYQRFLAWALEDGALTKDERDLTGRVGAALHLSPTDLREAHRRAFGIATQESVSDGHLSDDERLLLYTLQHALSLDPGLADGAFEVLARDKLIAAIREAMSGGGLSPEAAAEITRARENLGVVLPPAIAAALEGANERRRQRERPRPKRPRPGRSRSSRRQTWEDVRWAPITDTDIYRLSVDVAETNERKKRLVVLGIFTPREGWAASGAVTVAPTSVLLRGPDGRVTVPRKGVRAVYQHERRLWLYTNDFEWNDAGLVIEFHTLEVAVAVAAALG